MPVLSPITETTETLTALAEFGVNTPTHPSPTTYPNTTTYPGSDLGLRLTALTEV